MNFDTPDIKFYLSPEFIVLVLDVLQISQLILRVFLVERIKVGEISIMRLSFFLYLLDLLNYRLRGQLLGRFIRDPEWFFMNILIDTLRVRGAH
jgi:hypothetical protein